MKQEMTGWQWHQLDHMQIICTSLQKDNHLITQLLQARCSFRCPTSSVEALKAMRMRTKIISCDNIKTKMKTETESVDQFTPAAQYNTQSFAHSGIWTQTGTGFLCTQYNGSNHS